ncbi:hypothetical protein M9Y10_026850 [Tritrichomonas musculus]|uniref:Proteasome activator complex subunit 4 C-terminal domain-containing protein n=1 Tax=Tritrichomonas musculus TaxID=1915356 RepID=A0ABR2H6Q6_9EUKA
MKKKPSFIVQLYQRLSPPFCITYSQLHIFWESFYNELTKSYESSDFQKINYILSEISYNQGFDIEKIPQEFECDIIKILYKIITTLPIKNYLTQVNACTIAHAIITKRKKKLNLTLPWRPLYDFVKFILIDSDIRPIYIDASQIEDVLLVIPNFSPYFEKGSTKEIVNLLLPNISPHASNSSLYMTLLSQFVPVIADGKEYKEWLPDLITESVDIGSSERLTPLFRIISNVMSFNLEEDFTFLIPTIMSSFVQIIVNDSMPNPLVHEDSAPFLNNLKSFTHLTYYIAKSVLNLCFSPPSQEVAIAQLTTILNGVCDLYHPSISSNSPTMMVDFVNFFISKLSDYMHEMTLETSVISKDVKPTPEALHKLLKPIVDLHLIMIHTMSSSDYNQLISTIRIIGELDPTTLSRYFEFGFQCIMVTDAECVAEQGWTVISASLIGLRNSPLFQSHIKELIEIAINNMFIVELQIVLMTFFFVVFSIFPFDRELVSDDFEDFPFIDLSVKFITSIFDAGRSFPALQGKFAIPDGKFAKLTTMALHAFFMGASREVLESLQPILKSHLFDSSLIHSFSFFSAIYNFFFIVSDDTLRKPILKAMKKVISSNPDVMTTRAMIHRFLCGCALSAKNFDDYKEAIEFVRPFTEHPEKKVRKSVFNAILNSYVFTKEIAIVKPTKEMLIPLADFQYEFMKIPFTMNDIIPLFIDPFIEELMTIKDPTIFYEKLKEKRSMIVQMLHRVTEVEDGEIFDKSSLLTKSPFYIKELIKPSVSIREKFYKVILYGIETFSDNLNNITLLLDILYSLLYPILNIYTIKTTEMEIIKSFWLASRTTRKYNVFELSNRIEIMNENRHSQYHLPLSPLLKEVLIKVIPFGFSKFTNLRNQVCLIINGLLYDYEDFIAERLDVYLNETEIESVDEILQFFTFHGIFNLVLKKEKLLCTLLRSLCMQLKADNDETFNYLLLFAMSLCKAVFPYGVPCDKSEMWDKLLDDIMEFIRKSTKKDRMLHLLVSAVIGLSLGFTKNTSDQVIMYLVDMLENYDEQITSEAGYALLTILKRHTKETKIKKPFIGPKMSDISPVIVNSNKSITTTTKVDHNANHVVDGIEEEEEDIGGENSHPLIDCFIEEYIQPLNNSLNLPEDIYAFDKVSNGWHIYSDHFTIKKIDFWTDSPITSHLPQILMSSILSIDENSTETKPLFNQFWRNVAFSIGPTAMKVLIPVFENIFSSSMNEATAASLGDLISGFMMALPTWPDDATIEFEEKILGPYVIISSQNPVISGVSQLVFLLTSSSISSRRFYPLIQFLYDNSDMEPEGSISRRRLFDLLLSIIMWDSPTFYTSIDPLFEKFMQPFFDNYTEYNTIMCSSFFYLYFFIIESTCVLPTSPKYSSDMEAKRDYVVKKFSEVIKKSDPTQKAFHQLISVYLVYNESSSEIANKSMISVFSENVEIILKAVNSADVNTEDLLEPSVCSFLLNPIFINESHSAVEIIKKIINSFEILSPPMQLKFIQNISAMLSSIFYTMPKEELLSIYQLFLKLANQIKNENVLSEVLNILGVVLKYCPPVENMSKIEAAAIISSALVFDHVNEQVLSAFEIVRDAIESSSRSDTNLYKNVVKKFWQMNADHMLPQASEILSPYRLLVAPVYIT